MTFVQSAFDLRYVRLVSLRDCANRQVKDSSALTVVFVVASASAGAC